MSDKLIQEPAAYYMCENCSEHAPETCCYPMEELFIYEGVLWCEDCLADLGLPEEEWDKLAVFTPAIVAENERLQAKLERVDAVCQLLDVLVKQELACEMRQIDYENADFEGAYDTMVCNARDALRVLNNALKDQP